MSEVYDEVNADSLVIYKYKLAVVDEQVVNMPAGARVLSVGGQEGELVAWALVDQAATPEPIMFTVFGTGVPVPRSVRPQLGYTAHGTAGDFVGTAQVKREMWGNFVAHVWVKRAG